MRQIVSALAFARNILRQVMSAVAMITAAAFILFPLYLILVRGMTEGFYIGALAWSAFVLCTPIALPSSVFSLPFRLATGLQLPYAELISWIAALAINVHTYYAHKTVYLRLVTTHMLYHIISTPWPYWLIIMVCASAMIFRTFFGNQLRLKSFMLYLLINTSLIILGFATLFYFSYHDLVIILNVQA